MKDQSDDPSPYEQCSFDVTGINQDIAFNSQTTTWIEANFTSVFMSVHVGGYVQMHKYMYRIREHLPRKEGNVLFNDALNTFYLRLFGVRHMVKDHSDNEETCCRHIGYSFRLTARVLLYAPSHRQDST